MKNFASKRKSLLFLGFLVISLFQATAAQTFTGPGFTIIDNGDGNLASCSIVNVSGITTNVTVSNVTLTNLTHTYIGDTETAIITPASEVFDLASPPDFTECDYGGNYIFSDSGTTFIDAAAAGCADNDVIPGGTYRTSDYGGGDDPGVATSLASDLGTFTPAEANGTWRVCVIDYVGGDGGAVGGTSITFAGPTAASINIGGRVVTASGDGIRNALLTLTDGNGNVRTTVSEVSGEYVFNDLPAGTIYTISVTSKRFRFPEPARFFNGTEDFSGIDFVGYPIKTFSQLPTIKGF